MDTLLCILALLGLWQLLGFIWRWLFSAQSVSPQISLLFLVKDNQEIVEGLFRQLALDFHFQSIVPGRVTVFDLGSRDQSPAILRLLNRDLSYLCFREISEGQVGSALREFRQGVLVLDLRQLTAGQALAQSRYILDKASPWLRGQHHAQPGE